MKDCLGVDLKVGDKVICSDAKYADLLIGTVIGFTQKKARISYIRSEYQAGDPHEALKESYQIFKRPEENTTKMRKVQCDIYDRIWIIDCFDTKHNCSAIGKSDDSHIKKIVRECFITTIGIVDRSDDHLYYLQPVSVTPEEEQDIRSLYWERSWRANEFFESKEQAEKALIKEETE